MKHKSINLRRPLAVLMTVLMVMSAWVFVAPDTLPKAHAITSQAGGNYDIWYRVYDDGDGADGSKKIWVSDVRTDYNGRGTSSAWLYPWNGYQTSNMGSGGEGNGIDTAVYGYNGFPTNLWAKGEVGNWSYTDFKCKVWVRGADGASDWVVIADWKFHNKSFGGNNTQEAYAPSISNKPYFNSSTSSGATSIYTNGSTQSTYSVTSAKDQYNVNWGFTSVTWSSNHSAATIDNNGVATFGSNNGVDYDVTFTPTLVHSSGNVTAQAVKVHVYTPKKLDVNGYVYSVAKDTGANDGGLGGKATAKVYVPNNTLHASGNNVNDFYSDVMQNQTYKIVITPIAGWKMAGVKEPSSGYTTNTNTDSNVTVSGTMGSSAISFRFAMRPKVIKLTLNNQSATTAGTGAVYYKYQQNAAQDTTTTSTTGTYFTNGNNSNNTLTGKITAITKPAKDGYDFGGYYTATNGGGTQYIDANGSFVNNAYNAITSDTTLYAKWTPHLITATLNKNSGSGGTDKVYYKYQQNGYYSDSACTTSLNNKVTIPTRVGYTFKGYFERSDGSGEKFIDENGAFTTDLYNRLGTNKALQLYANWTRDNYAVEYADNTTGDILNVNGAAAVTIKVTPIVDHHLTNNITVKAGSTTLVKDTDYTFNFGRTESTVSILAGKIGGKLEVNVGVENCSGGTATCKTLAICDTCGESYGEVDPVNGHDFTGAVRSDGNGQNATHSFLCKNGCNTYGGAVTHKWNSGEVTKQPGCATTGVKTYTCQTDGCGATYTETLDATGAHEFTVPKYDENSHWNKCANCDATNAITAHTYTGAPTWGTWSADNSTITATFKCDGCDHTITPEVTVTSVTTPAACEKDSYTIYTASVENNSQTYTTATQVNHTGTALEHDWQFDSFAWAADNKTAKVNLVCGHDSSHTKQVNAEMSSAFTAATCEDDAYTVYTATYGTNTDSKTVTNEGTATDHAWKFVSFAWAVDNKTAKVNLVCENDANHTKQVDATMSDAFTAATCTADAYTVYTATYGTNTESKTVTDAGTATDHAWKFVSFEWAADSKTAKVNLVCKNDGNHTTQVDATMSSAFTAATCEDDAYTVYTATYGTNTDSKTVTDEGTATDHNWQFVSFAWAADNTTAQVNLVCSRDSSHTKQVNATMSSAFTAATCTADAYTVYTATYDDHTDSKTVTDEGTKLGHDWKFVSFAWAADNKTAKVNLVCENDANHTTQVDAEMSSVFTAATCEDDAYTVYTATYGTNTDSKTVTDEGTATGHNYVFSKFVWSQDGTTAQAKYICSNDESHVEFYNAAITPDPHAPTCEAAGYTDYNASYDGHTDTNRIDGEPATGHAYAFSEFVWADDGTTAQAKLVCANDSAHVIYEDAQMTHEDHAATCADAPYTTYTATYGDKTATNDVITGEALGHQYGELVPATAASCTEDGNIAYYYCPVCETYFNEAKEEVTSIVASASGHDYGELHAAVSETCTTDGNVAYYQCSICHKYFSEAKQEIETYVIPSPGHAYGAWIPAVETSCTAPGSLGHYHCSVCGKDFDESHNEIADVVIAQLAHIFAGEIKDNGDGTHSFACTYNCGTYGNATAHAFTEVATDAFMTDPGDCTTPPTYVMSCVCGARSTETFNGTAPGHSFITKDGKEPTCSEPGYAAYEQCSVCGFIQGEQTLPIVDHNYVRDEAASGHVFDQSVQWDVYTCSFGCGKSYTLFTAYVRNDKGVALSGAKVRLTGNDMSEEGITDSEGKVAFTSHFTDGAYELTVNYSGDDGTGKSYGKFNYFDGTGSGGFGTMTTTGAPVTEPEEETPTDQPTTDDSGNGGTTPTTPRRCSWCDINEKWENTPVIGWIVAFIHMIIHAVQAR